MSIKRVFRSLVASVVLVVLCSSCGVSKMSQQIQFKGIKEFSLKGLTALQVDARIANSSRHDLHMSEGEVTLYRDGERAVVLTQVGEAISPAGEIEDIETLWKISGFDPRKIGSFVSMLSDKELDDVSVDYTARLSVKGFGRTISQENVDLRDFIAIFAKKVKVNND